MAINSGMVTQGTDFRISVDGVTFTSVGCVESWDLSTSDRAEIDTTCLKDTSKSFKFGLKDSGTLSLELMYSIDSAGQALMEQSYQSPDAFKFEVEYSDNAGTSGTIKAFSGYVINLSETGGKDDVIKQSVTIKISGDITTTAPVA